MALMMAARAPSVWTAVSVWVPITDLAAWYRFSKETGSQYYRMMDQCSADRLELRTATGSTIAVRPCFILSRAKKLRIAIGRRIERRARPQRPCRCASSLDGFNALARANGFADKALAEADVESMTREARIPARLSNEKEEDPARKEKILFRRRAGPVTLTIFDGGHSVDVPTGIRYFE